MEKIELLQTLHQLIDAKCSNSEYLERGEELVLAYLADHPEDIEMWYKLAFLELLSPLVDYQRAIQYLKMLWEDRQEIKALIYIAIIQDIHCVMSEDIFVLLKNYPTIDTIVLAMIHYCIGLYYLSGKQVAKAEEYFLKSVKNCPYFVRAYLELSDIYKDRDFTLSHLYCQKAVEGVTEMDTDIDLISIGLFEKESIFGCYVTEAKYEYLLDTLKLRYSKLYSAS